jgi:hypothetical protein
MQSSASPTAAFRVRDCTECSEFWGMTADVILTYNAGDAADRGCNLHGE